MGIPSEMRDRWRDTDIKGLLIASPADEQKMIRSSQCTTEGVLAGFKAACIASVVSAVPTLAAVRTIPWAKANINHTGQALIVSAAAISSFFITADKTILECARKNSQQLEEALKQ